MRARHPILFFFSAILFTFGIPVSFAKNTRITCVTSSCHTEIKSKAAFLHSPLKADGCHVCHLPSKGKPPTPNEKLPKDHPRIQSIKKLEINATCVVCHDDFADNFKLLPVQHKALEEKTCTSCHNPHASSYPHLLIKESKDSSLCFSCHEKIKKGMQDSTFQHGALSEKEGCLNCHEPHFSQETALLKSPPGTLCLTCHSKEIHKKDGKTLINLKAKLDKNEFKHKPVKQGKCTSMCHTPHSSSHKPLLAEAFSPQFFQKFDEKEFELCFQCHETELATKQIVEDETRFRNGEKNMHFFHLNAHKKGFGCAACHDVHASDQPRLIKSWVPFQGLEVPQKYSVTKTGGTCANACHGSKSYDREEAIINDKAR